METFSVIVRSFIAFVRLHSFRVSHELVVPFITKLLEILKDESFSEEEKVLHDLLCKLLERQRQLSDTGATSLRVSVVHVMETLIADSLSPGRLARKFQTEEEYLLQQIQELHTIGSCMMESENGSLKETTSTPTFHELLQHPWYVTHFVAHPDHSTSRVIVVLWKDPLPGPAMTHQGLWVVYAYCPTTPSKCCSESWGFPPPAKKVYSSSDVEEAARVRAIIAEHQASLFRQHSTLVALKSSGPVEGVHYIDCVVLAKNFVPIQDGMKLPRFVGGVPTRVLSGIVKLCGQRELSFHRPMLPGAGFAAGPDALLDLNVSANDYKPPVMGALGGTYHHGNDIYGVACAHSLLQNHIKELYPPGTPVYQPSALGFVLASVDKEVKAIYEGLQDRKGAWFAANYLMGQAGPAFQTDLPEGAQCGTVYNGVFGPVGNSTTAVDCALIRLTTDMDSMCDDLPDIPPVCPELRLGDGATTPLLDSSNLPACEFDVYGQGAMSPGMMRATVDPTEYEIWFRVVTDGHLGDLTFECIHGKVRSNWTAGDSGTWCWTEDGKLVGMGMAYAQIENRDYCCMLPMNDVVAAIEHMLP